MQIVQNFAAAGGGVIMVMHDLNLTAMCANSVLLMAGGELLHHGAPETCFRNDLLSQAYRCHIEVNAIPKTGVYLLPQVACNFD